MSSQKPLIFLAFANDQGQPLANLKVERKAIKDVFSALEKQQKLIIKEEAQSDVKDIFTAFNRYRGQFSIFHYGGHANSSSLTLEDASLQGSTLSELIRIENQESATGVALVFLNGCVTQYQVKDLLAAGARCVIGTQAHIEDNLATEFARQFYEALEAGKTIQNAFDTAQAFINKHVSGSDRIRWSFHEDEVQMAGQENLYWGIFANENKYKKWRLIADEKEELITDNQPVITQEPLLRHNVPPRPGFFLGRQDILDKMHAKLSSPENRSNILLLNAIGGMGKTTVMQEYLYLPMCQNHFKRIVHISINNNVQNAFVMEVAEALKVDLKSFPKPEDQLNIVKNALQKYDGHNLLVLDNINAEDREALKDLSPHLKKIGWKVLITTRTAPPGFDKLEIPELAMPDARRLFAYHYATDEDFDKFNPNQAALLQELDEFLANQDVGKVAEQLLEQIHRHTLLIELVGKIGCQGGGLAIGRLLELFQETDTKIKFAQKELNKLIPIGPNAEYGYRLEETYLHDYLLALFDTSYLTIDNSDPAKKLENERRVTMLRFFSVLPPVDIPIKDLQVLWKVADDGSDAFLGRLDQLKFAGWLHGKSQIRTNKGERLNRVYKMHPLVQEVVYIKHTPDINNVRPLVQTITQMLAQPLNFSHHYQPYAKSVIDKLNLLNQKAMGG